MRISSHIHRLLAAVTAIAYLAGVFGFDIHSSEDAQRTYVIPLFAGISCEHIHPDAPCHHHGAEECDDHEDCCHDTFGMLDITGSGPAGAVAVPIVHALLPAAPAPAVAAFAAECASVRPALHFPPPPDLSMMCVLRV